MRSSLLDRDLEYLSTQHVVVSQSHFRSRFITFLYHEVQVQKQQKGMPSECKVAESSVSRSLKNEITRPRRHYNLQLWTSRTSVVACELVAFGGWRLV
jgi:hypothetical protein